MLDGRDTFWNVRDRGRGTGEEDLSKLCCELLRSMAGLDDGLVGVGGIAKVEVWRSFFLSVDSGGLPGTPSCIGVRLVTGGRKMLRLFLLLRPDISVCLARLC